jgi:septal ring factor EnvC (AmiA/AmiB activator)
VPTGTQTHNVAVLAAAIANLHDGGGIPGFTYAPTSKAVLGGPSDAKSRYDKEIEDLKKAWDDLNKALKDAKKKADDLKAAEKNLSKVRHGHHTAAQLRSAEERVDKAGRRSARRTPRSGRTAPPSTPPTRNSA